MVRGGERLGRWIEANPIVILTLAALLTVASIHYAQTITMETEIETFVDADSRLYVEFSHLYNDRFGTQSIVVLVEGDSVTTPGSLKAMERLTRQMEAVDYVLGTVSLAEMVMEVEAEATGIRRVPDSQARIDEILEELERTNPAALKAILPDRRHTIIPIDLPTYIPMASLEAILPEARSAVAMADFPAGADTIVTGEIALGDEIEREMNASMTNLLLISGLLMIVALILVFRHVSLPLLPLPVVFLGIIWTFGMMGFLQVPLTMVSMAAFPILIGIGIDYAIQFQNRIEEEFQRGGSISKAAIETVARIAPAVLIALIITGAGFFSLFSSSVPMVRDFGLLCLIGIIMCYLSSLFVGVTVIHLMERGRNERNSRNGAVRKERRSPITPIIVSYVSLILSRWRAVLGAAVLLSLVGLYADTHVPIETDLYEFIPQDLPPLIQFRHLHDIFGGEDRLNIIVQGDVVDPSTLRWMDQFGEYVVGSRDQVHGASSLATLVKGYHGGTIPHERSEVVAVLEELPEQAKYQYVDGHDTAQIILDIGDAFKNLGQVGVERLMNEVDKDLQWFEHPPGISVTQTGDMVVMNTVIGALTTGRIRMTLLGLVLIFSILLLIYRDLGKAVLPVLPMFMVIGWMGGVMYISGMTYNPMTATLGALILGVGSEYAILTMERFYEEKEKTEDAMEALSIATGSIGAAIFASGLTTIFGFSALIASPFPMTSSFGTITVLSVIFALFATFTVFPVLLIRLEYWRRHKAVAIFRGSNLLPFMLIRRFKE
ncbi:RND family transporter [Candidatus Methanocrinis natronophilus]|uniref:RND family transporter n=1 Tax=Candidatus Methanocrinis natronophilus TaxID=3033396 RepID=A0ABT5X525_9EURY|nr:RND family transporter [Candidatus Methanocrinis natronophilus]MDF0589753.1 RND family transporter [Candidatus Methanocrinis natronophilus]